MEVFLSFKAQDLLHSFLCKSLKKLQKMVKLVKTVILKK